jgi:hypothetical protein
MTALRPLIPEHRKRSLRLGHDKPYASSFHYRQDQERMSQRGWLPIACLPGGASRYLLENRQGADGIPAVRGFVTARDSHTLLLVHDKSPCR